MSFARTAWTKLNELVLNIETVPESLLADMVADAKSRWRVKPTEKAKYHDGVSCASPDYLYLWKTAKLLRPGPNDTVYDLGCGMGRFLCVISRWPIKRCVGVELFEPLCEIAKINALRVRGRKARIDIVCEDCAKADLSEGTIYYMYNPFGLETMHDVIENIHHSVLREPRRVTIAYHNAMHDEVLRACDWLQLTKSFRTAGGTRVGFWRHTPAQS